MNNHYDQNDVFDAECEHRLLKIFIKQSSEYRANPDNIRHPMYLKACNRWFWATLLFLPVAFWPLFPEALTAITFLFLMFLIGVLSLWALATMFNALMDAWKWLSASGR